MRIALVRPPSILGELTETSALHHPINLAYLGAALKSAGHEPVIVDYEVVPYDVKAVTGLEPDAVGITSVTANVHLAGELARKIKAVRPGTVVFLGGAHATVLPTRTLRDFPSIDACVVGEGEKTIVEAVDLLGQGGIIEGVQGLSIRIPRGIEFMGMRPLVEDLDSMPFPDRSLIRMELYRRASSPGYSRRFLRITEIFTSRGCAHRCIFCAAPVIGGGKVRFRSIGSVIAEMQSCIRQYGIQHFTINDDNFAADCGRVLAFCEAASPLKVTWSCETRVNVVDKELLAAMKNSGCVKINFGPESGSPKVLKLLKKGITVEAVERAFALAKEAGIQRMGFFQIGSHPDENIEDVRLTSGLIRRIAPDFITISISTPYPGTELYNIMKERHLIRSENWADFRLFGGSPAWETANFTSASLTRMQRNMTREFYFRPGYILRRLIRVRSPREIFYWFKAGISLLRFFWTGAGGKRN